MAILGIDPELVNISGHWLHVGAMGAHPQVMMIHERGPS